MTTITTQSVNKLIANISYLKENANSNSLINRTWIDGLLKSSKETFDSIKSIASGEYSTISLAMDLINKKQIKTEI